MEVVPLSAAEKPTTTKQTWATTVNGSKLVTSSNDESKNNNDNIKVSDVDSLPEKCTDNVKDDVKIIGGSSKEDDDGKAKEPSLKTRIAKSINPKGNCVEKLVFILSIAGVMLCGFGVVSFPWILPYFYTATIPFLMGLRIWLYWEAKWQLFLVDFCYVTNLLLFIYLWACPGLETVFCTVFASANGPLLFAIITYRNTFAFHSLDRMCSVFIHILPSLITFSIRWHSTQMPWYSSFPVIDAESKFDIPWVWILAVPYGFYVLHTIIYYTVVYLIIKPNEEFLDTYRYMTGVDSGKYIAKFVNIFGPKYTPILFISANWTYTIITYLCAVLLFKYFIAHCVFLTFIGLVLTWNGASFYMDVFTVKGLDAEPYRFCLK